MWWRRNKILHIISSSNIGGAEKCFLEMLSGLAGLGYKMAAVCSGGELFNMVKGVCPETYAVDMMDNFDLFSLYKLKKIISETSPGLCHLHMNRATLLGALASKSCNVPSIGTIQGEVRPIYARFPDYLTFCSKNVADFVRKKSFKIRQKPSFFLYNRIDAALIRAQAKNAGRAFVSKEFGIPEDAFVLCIVARLHVNKGHEYLLDALSAVKEAIPSLYCLIVGAGEAKYEDALKKKASELHIADKVVFCGTRMDVPAILSGSDLFVLPSLQEGIPVTIMESLCIGLPVVAFDVGGISELCYDNGRMMPYIELIAPGDTVMLARRISEVFSNYAKYKSNAEKAALMIGSKYDKKAYIEEIDAIYKDVLKRKIRSNVLA